MRTNMRDFDSVPPSAPPEPPRERALALLKAAAELLQKVVALAHAQPDARGGSLLHDDAEARLNDVLRALSLLAAARGATEGDGAEAGSKRKRGEEEE